MTRVRGIRGATTASANTREAILEATRELFEAMVRANGLRPDDVASIVLTVTPDLDAAFPGAAVREQGWSDVAVLDAQAPRVAGDESRCIRALVNWNTDRCIDEVRHVYLHGARTLRPDRAEDPYLGEGTK